MLTLRNIKVDRYYIKPVRRTVSIATMHAMIQHNISILGLPPSSHLGHKGVKIADRARLLGPETVRMRLLRCYKNKQLHCIIA